MKSMVLGLFCAGFGQFGLFGCRVKLVLNEDIGQQGAQYTAYTQLVTASIGGGGAAGVSPAAGSGEVRSHGFFSGVFS